MMLLGHWHSKHCQSQLLLKPATSSRGDKIKNTINHLTCLRFGHLESFHNWNIFGSKKNTDYEIKHEDISARTLSAIFIDADIEFNN